jgi:3-methyl-2-oxobutanoate hydroxymethyltransferase
MVQRTGKKERVTLDTLRQMKAAGQRFAMLTAYDYPTAAAAADAGVHALLIGDSMGAVLLGHETTRQTPLALMLILGEAVRRGAPDLFLCGDVPFEAATAGQAAVVEAACRFRDEAGCDAVKVEVAAEEADWITGMANAGIRPVAHLGLRPQQVTAPSGYKPQARHPEQIPELVRTAERMTSAGADMLLLEAVPAEAAEAVVAAATVPVIGCGAGPGCDGHVLVTQDMLGYGLVRPPRFVPVHGSFGELMRAAMERYVRDIEAGTYPAPEHVYPLRAPSATSAGDS